MLFWLFVVILILGILLCCLTNFDFEYEVRKKHPILNWLHYNETPLYIGVTISIISAICVVISLFCIIGEHITADSYVAMNKERYESLCYKLESENARDEFGLLNKGIVDEIQDWNEDLAYYQSVQDDFWLGIYYPNVYDQFGRIELKK